MSTVVLTIQGPTAAQVAAMERLPRRFLGELLNEFDRANQEVTGHIVARRLGPGAPKPYPVSEHRLRRVSSRLAQSARPSKAVVQGDAVVSAIGTNVRYGAAHEFGFSGEVQVRAHRRRRFTTTKAGKTYDLKTGKFGRGRAKKTQSGEHAVRAHKRMVKIPERAMFRTGIEEKMSAYDAAVARALDRAARPEGGTP